MTDCTFCKIAQAELKARIVYADEDVVAFQDADPQAPTHIIVTPRQHISGLNDCRPEDTAILGKMVQTCKSIAERTGINETGFRIVMNTGDEGGQLIDHIHFHVLGGRQMSWPPG